MQARGFTVRLRKLAQTGISDERRLVARTWENSKGVILAECLFEVVTEGPGKAEANDYGTKGLDGKYTKRGEVAANTTSDKPASVGAPMEAK